MKIRLLRDLPINKQQYAFAESIFEVVRERVSHIFGKHYVVMVDSTEAVVFEHDCELVEGDM